jgi:hypothetical protein
VGNDGDKEGVREGRVMTEAMAGIERKHRRGNTEGAMKYELMNTAC